jgi:hypothetical protein
MNSTYLLFYAFQRVCNVKIAAPMFCKLICYIIVKHALLFKGPVLITSLYALLVTIILM